MLHSTPSGWISRKVYNFHSRWAGGFGVKIDATWRIADSCLDTWWYLYGRFKTLTAQLWAQGILAIEVWPYLYETTWLFVWVFRALALFLCLAKGGYRMDSFDYVKGFFTAVVPSFQSVHAPWYQVVEVRRGCSNFLGISLSSMASILGALFCIPYRQPASSASSYSSGLPSTSSS